MASTDSRYLINQAEIADHGLQVDWGDGHQSHFHSVWLRHQCECDACGTPMNAVRALRIHHIPEDISIASFEFNHQQVKIGWSQGAHHSTYKARWLRDHCYSDGERKLRKHRPVLWDASIGQNPPVFNFKEAEADSATRLAMLESVCDYGFCKIENLSGNMDESNRLIELVGTQRQTHFGNYQLSKKSSINNVGDIKHELQPHCDETYRTSTIGITVFQVMQPSSEGGESTLMDGFEAARRLRQNFPSEFELLTRTPVFAQRYDPDHAEGELPRLYQCRLPMIRLDADGDISGVRINERQMAPLDLPANQIEPCYRAIRHLMKIVYDPDLLITFSLKKGEGLLFDNQRVLHGRTAFEAEQPGRSVLTNSVNLEDFYSNLRVLTTQHKPDQPPRTYAQGLVV
ncbi:MAG: TauD/TfdA family dioxygenase [Gammaproteobacteria bacterium]